jgi:hypothetical protein
MSMLRNYPLGVFLAFYIIVLVHFGVEAAKGRKNGKSSQESSWDKVASGVKATSWLFIAEMITI